MSVLRIMSTVLGTLILIIALGDPCHGQSVSIAEESDKLAAAFDPKLEPPASSSQADSFAAQTSTTHLPIRDFLHSNLRRSAREQQRDWVSKIPISVQYLGMYHEEDGLNEFDTSIKFPILKIFGTPPPIVKTGFVYTDLHAGERLGLPGDFYQYTIGVSLVRQLTERWTLRAMIGAGFATDNQNTTSDAWQFRGGIFGIFRWNEKWQTTVGAIALGRDDLPAVPALGAIWTPTRYCRWDLIPPNPKVNFLILDDGKKQNWIYFGGGFNGNTWAYQTLANQNDRLTYSDLRLFAGWQSTPKAAPGVPFARGRKYDIELGYAFSRDIELDSAPRQLPLESLYYLRIGTRF